MNTYHLKVFDNRNSKLVMWYSVSGSHRSRSVLNKLMSYNTTGPTDVAAAGSMGLSSELLECPYNMAAPKKLLSFMTCSTSRDPHNGTNKHQE